MAAEILAANASIWQQLRENLRCDVGSSLFGCDPYRSDGKRNSWSGYTRSNRWSFETSQLENGLRYHKKRCRYGCHRYYLWNTSNVTSDAAALTLRVNAVVLRSSGMPIKQPIPLSQPWRRAWDDYYSSNVIQLVEDTSRESSYAMMKAKGLSDLLIPRRGWRSCTVVERMRLYLLSGQDWD